MEKEEMTKKKNIIIMIEFYFTKLNIYMTEKQLLGKNMTYMAKGK